MTGPELTTHALHLALEVDGDGAHPASWRHSGRPPGAVLGPRALRETVADAQRAGFALATFADSPLPPSQGRDASGRLEAGTRAAYVAPLTDRIGLAPTLHATVTEPFHLATQLAALDHASHGWAGWVVGAANSEAAHATIGAEPLAFDALHQEVADVVETARALWDSWQDDAVIKDVATGRYLDADKVHHIDFTGARFTVKGPLITPRPPQGQILVLASDALEIDALADVVLIGRPDPEAIGTRASQAKREGAPLAFAELEVVLDTDRASAAERLARLDAATPWPATTALRHVGSADALVDLLERLADVVDGVRLHPAVLAVDLPILTAKVLPALDARGLLRIPRDPGATLRDALGLSRPANRFARAASSIR